VVVAPLPVQNARRCNQIQVVDNCSFTTAEHGVAAHGAEADSCLAAAWQQATTSIQRWPFASELDPEDPSGATTRVAARMQHTAEQTTLSQVPSTHRSRALSLKHADHHPHADGLHPRLARQ
jgi:hypothetical protein